MHHIIINYQLLFLTSFLFYFMFVGNDRSRILHFYGDRFLRLRVADYFPYLRYALYNIIVHLILIMSLLRSLPFLDSFFCLVIHSNLCFLPPFSFLFNFLTISYLHPIEFLIHYVFHSSIIATLSSHHVTHTRTYKLFCTVLLLNVQQAKSQCGTSRLLSRSLSMTSSCATWQPMSLLWN